MLWDEHGALATTLILSQCVCCIGRGASMQASGARQWQGTFACAPQLIGDNDQARRPRPPRTGAPCPPHLPL